MWWKVTLGAVIVLFTLWEMFQDLFHPTRSGALSENLAHGVFVSLRRWPSALPSAGPLTVVIVIFTWSLLLVAGFAFIYWAVFPAAFDLKTADQPAGSDGYLWSFYYSMEMLTTLGLGDIQPRVDWLRILSAVHSLVGFSLISASITWILLIFPALRRTRTLARKAHTLAAAEDKTGVPVSSPDMHVILAGLAEEVIRTRVDLIHFPILFYFYSQDPRASMASAVFPLLRFAAAGSVPGQDPVVRLASAALREALDDLAEKIGYRLDCEEAPTEEKFRAFAELHLHAIN